MVYSQKRLPVGASEPEVARLGDDPLPELAASLDRLADIHRRMDGLHAKPGGASR